MPSIFELMATSLGGSMIGAVGAIFNKIHDGRQAIKMADHEFRMTQLNQAHEAAMSQLQAQVKVGENQAALALEEMKGSYTTLQASIESDKATFSNTENPNKWLVFVDVIRGTMRSWITTALLFYLGLFLFYITNRYQVQLTVDQVNQIVMQIIQCLLAGSSLSLAWWFGSRNINQKG